MTTKKHKGAGTLISLIVAMGIISFLSAISIPYIRKNQPSLKLAAAGRDLASDLRYAQQLTISEQDQHQLTINRSAGSYEIIKIGIATTTIKSSSLPTDIDFANISGLTDDKVIFNAYGGVYEAGAVTLQNSNGQTAVINIKPSGYIQLAQ